ncbi:MAG: hypothetical protein P9X22_03335, partial [Candidatus Zapsychrus exili]|nr:hypothetical protein [Candidatus Zapsychrus exili]
NCYVVLISSLFSFFIFVLTGATVFFALVVISYLGVGIMGLDFERSWSSILSFCMVSLTLLVTLFNLVAISKNFKLKQNID